MKYVMIFVWSLLLVSMLNYVVGAIGEAPFVFSTGAIVSVIFSIFVIIIGESLPEGPVSDH